MCQAWIGSCICSQNNLFNSSTLPCSLSSIDLFILHQGPGASCSSWPSPAAGRGLGAPLESCRGGCCSTPRSPLTHASPSQCLNLLLQVRCCSDSAKGWEDLFASPRDPWGPAPSLGLAIAAVYFPIGRAQPLLQPPVSLQSPSILVPTPLAHPGICLERCSRLLAAPIPHGKSYSLPGSQRDGKFEAAPWQPRTFFCPRFSSPSSARCSCSSQTQHG